MLDLALKLIVAIVAFGAMMILNFAIFRIEIRVNHMQITIMAVVVGLTNFYLKFIIDSPYYSISQLFFTIVLFLILRKYPIMYALIISVTGAFFISLIDGIITFAATGLKIVTLDQILNDTLYYIIFHLIVTLFYLAFAYVLVKRKLGFSFIVRRFTGKGFLKTYNFIWACLLIAGAAFLQLSVQGIHNNLLHCLLIIVMTLFLIATVLYAYVQNKKVVVERYKNDGGDKTEHSGPSIK